MALNYTTVEKILVTLPMVGSVTSITSAVLEAFAGQAEALVDAKLAKAFTVPVSGSPPLLEMLSTDIALYRLLTRRMFTQEQINKSDWPDRYKESLDTLDKLVEGELQLLTTSGDLIAPAQASAQAWSNTQTYEPTFNELPMEMQDIDANEMADLGWITRHPRVI
jgi:phage gp36-like protein